MRPIDADALEEVVQANLRENPHKNGRARAFHNTEYIHFLDVIRRMPTIPLPPNDPLTPEQLLELEGEPVWLGGDGLNRWDIFSGVSTDGIACFLRAALLMDSCGRTWSPFRRKPEEEMNDE